MLNSFGYISLFTVYDNSLKGFNLLSLYRYGLFYSNFCTVTVNLCRIIVLACADNIFENNW